MNAAGSIWRRKPCGRTSTWRTSTRQASKCTRCRRRRLVRPHIDEDKAEGGLRFSQWLLAGVYCSASKPGGMVDSVYRCFTMTAEQAVDEFGENEVSEDTRKLATNKPDEKIEFVHAIYPRTLKVENPRLAKNLPIASVHVEVKQKKIVRESGYHEMPVVVPRWMLIPIRSMVSARSSTRCPT